MCSEYDGTPDDGFMSGFKSVKKFLSIWIGEHTVSTETTTFDNSMKTF